MATKTGDFCDILLRNNVVSREQLDEARKMAKQSKMTVGDALVRLGYASGVDVMRAVAEEHRLDFIDLNEVVIPPSVIELMPESVARENVILPMSEEDGR